METEQEEGRTDQERMEGCRAVEIQDRKEWKHGWRKLLEVCKQFCGAGRSEIILRIRSRNYQFK